MHLRFEESDRLVARLRSGTNTAKLVEEIRRDAERRKPPGYNDTSRALSKCYLRQQEDLTKAHIQMRMPDAGKDFPIVIDNLVRQVADTDGQTYSTPPDRYLQVRLSDGTEMNAASAGEVQGVDYARRQMNFEQMLRRARIDTRMVEADRRASLPPEVYLRVHAIRPVPGDPKPLRLSLSLYWGHQVIVQYAYGSPGDLDRAVLIIAETTTDEGELADEVWTRETMVEDGQLMGFGPWMASIVPRQIQGKPLKPEIPLYGDGVAPLSRAPWLRYTPHETGANGYTEEGNELLQQQMAINMEWSIAFRTDELQAYGRLVYAGDSDKLPNKLQFGPGRIARIGTGENMFELPVQTSMVTIEKVERYRSAVAVARRQPVDAYSLEKQTQVLSGVALKTYREPQLQALRERRTGAKLWEQEHLLPLLASVHDYYAENEEDLIAHSPRDSETEAPMLDGVSFRCDFQEEGLVESEDEKLARTITKKAEGLISPARAGVQAGEYESEAEAEAAGLPAQIRRPVPTLSAPDAEPGPPGTSTGGLSALASLTAGDA